MNNLRGKNAILYRRVSTTDQKTFGNSLNAQQSSLKDFCDKNALNVIKEFQEDYSAKDFNRPEWKRLNKFAKENKKKIDYLLITSWDRFSRNTYEALGRIYEMRELGVEINSVENWIDQDWHKIPVGCFTSQDIAQLIAQFKGHKIINPFKDYDEPETLP